MKLLIVEDEVELCRTLAEGFRISGYEVDTCYNGADALEICTYTEYDLILLDLGLPIIDGVTVLETFRKTNHTTPILILSARGEIIDKVACFDMGANDYLTKPFNFDELEARVRSLTRRKFIQNDLAIKSGNVSFNLRTRVLKIQDAPLSLTRKETGIVEYLLTHQNEVISSEELLEHVWDNNVDLFSNSIRVHISSLRKKLRAALGFDPIKNRIGEGYIWEDGEQ